MALDGGEYLFEWERDDLEPDRDRDRELLLLRLELLEYERLRRLLCFDLELRLDF